ncbi:hypothetical protein G5V65_21230 [Rhodobacter sp. HX-7-19]|uniref:Bacteriophage-related protein n=1 Tax=Paragemmobacter kunshanensis TaxID=2583234 RepID=A0A6M1TYR8_9RHOB|nr:hypothetical protein [Rhodobacter kunshanensis]NGQ93410.1 hypothetical protein [Rhodobacter kunshanensis]
MNVYSPEIVTVHVPFRIAKRGGRKSILPPADAPAPRHVDSTLVRALARAFRWRRMLDAGEFLTISELAAHEKVAPSYVTRILRLTALAPGIIEAILDGTAGPEVTLAGVVKPFSEVWAVQEIKLSTT